MEKTTLISIQNLSKEFNGRRVLDVQELSFDAGRVYALTGHNGSGKTTLLRILAGLEKPSSGGMETTVDRSRIGFCPQKPFMFRGNAGKNLTWGLEAADAGKVAEIVRRLRLEPLLNLNAKKLSAGEMQKVSIGRMLLRDPDLLLLDEPTANLDTDSRAAIEEAIARFAGSGRTCVIATHMSELALRIAADIVRLEQGRVTHAEIANVFEGDVRHDGTATVIQVTNMVCVHCAERAVTGRRRFCIASADIVLSAMPLESSMRNCFTGVITGLRQSGDAVEATIDAGIPLRALITPESLAAFSLSIGSPVTASFKATAVRLL